jgi:hypothetical protein
MNGSGGENHFIWNDNLSLEKVFEKPMHVSVSLKDIESLLFNGNNEFSEIYHKTRGDSGLVVSNWVPINESEKERTIQAEISIPVG